MTLASLLGPPGSGLRRWRLLLGAGLILLVVYLLGPYQPWRLDGEPTLIPRPGQKRIHIILVATWWAAAVNAVLAVFLLATSGLWARDRGWAQPDRAAPRARVSRASLLLLLLACALAGALRWKLAHGGVSWDEAWTVRHAVVGTMEPDPVDPSKLVFEPVPWTNTLWYYRKPTNHVLYSIAARFSLAGWRAATGAEPRAWDEFALRLPAYAAAILSVLLLGLLVHDLGFPRAAPAAALLLAIHPWHIRFGADGRGYAFMVLAAILGAWCLLHGLRDGRWRWWLGFAASQLALLWIHALSFYFPVALGAAGALGIALGPEEPRERGLRLGRFVAANLMAAMAYLQLMGPNLAQGLAYSMEWEQPKIAPMIGRRTWLFLSTGLPQALSWDPDYRFPTLKVLWGGGGWVRGVAYGLLPALTALGLARVLARPGPERFVWLGLAAAVPLALLHRAIQGFLLVERFTIYALIAVVPLLVIGVETLAQIAVPRGWRRIAVPSALAAFLVAFQAFVVPQTRVLLERPHMPSRDVAEYLARAGEGIPGGVIRAGVALGGNLPDVYDPYVQQVHTREEVAALCRRSLAEGRPLYVFYGYNDPNRKGKSKGVVEDLDDPRYFEEVAHLPGIESDFVFRIFRYTGRPLGG